MNDSGRKIDYSIRPAKAVERKIICKILSCLQSPTPINQYRYIGFGSFYFSDFVLFHNALNIDSMISIEHSSEIARYQVNKPYKCIEIKNEEAQLALSSSIPFDEDKPDFIWLDYDEAFSKDMVSDLFTASQKVNNGSIVFVSFNASLPDGSDEERKIILEKNFGEYFAKDKFRNFDNDSFPEIIYSIIDSAIKKSVSERIQAPLDAQSVFYIRYRDGAPMYTLGYYFFNDYNAFDNEAISAFPGVTTDNKPQKLLVPCFTHYEIHEMNKLLPGSTPEEIKEKIPYLDLEDIKKYTKLYQFYPHFIDSPYYT